MLLMEWEILEDGETEGSTLGWILSEGLSLGKKLVITGVVISSLPLVLPPLVVISALGLAFSVPFGVVYGSYACTEKLMSQLLPSPTVLAHKDQPVVAGDEKEEKEMTDGVEMRIELVDDDDYTELRNKGYGKCEGPILQVQTDDFVDKEGEKNIRNRAEIENVSECENEKVEKRMEKGRKRQTISKWKSSSKEKNRSLIALEFPGKRKEPEGYKRDEKVFKKEKEILGETNLERKFGAGEKLCPEVVLQATSTDEKAQVGEQECVSENLEDNQQSFSISNHNDAGSIEGSLQKEDKSVGLKEMLSVEDGLETSKQCTVYNDTGENQNHSRMIAADGGYSLETKDDAHVPELKEGEDACADEGLFGEDEIWEKIDAIRVIVGFKAPRSPSYFEELKALHLFTGIEPPSSSLDPSHLASLHNQLSFLMSVIGLK